MRSLILTIFFVTFLGVYAAAQEKLTWDDFADVRFEPVYNEVYDVHFLMPKFGEKIKSYSGKKVSITGYFLDISGTGEVFLVSKNPMASCFFCGAAGPETIVEPRFKEKPSYTTDQIIEVTGVLKLNADDVDQCNYVLEGASAKLIN